MTDLSVPSTRLSLDDLSGDRRRMRTEAIVKWVLSAAATVSAVVQPSSAGSGAVQQAL